MAVATKTFQKAYPQGPKQYRLTVAEVTPDTAILLTEKVQNGNIYATVVDRFASADDAREARKALGKSLTGNRSYAKVDA